jgi:signal transduction histidine kinase
VDRQKIYPFSLGTALIQIRSINGEILTQVGDFGDLKIPFKREFSQLEKGDEKAFRTFGYVPELSPGDEPQSFRVVNLPIDNSPVPQLILQVAVPLTFIEGQIHTRKVFLELLIPLILFVATLGGYFLSTRALMPVAQLIGSAHEIEALNLSARLPVPVAKDEIRSLATTLNEMLNRIENSFLSQEKFIADASHQLLTPLSIMKGELESHAKHKDLEIARPLLSSLSQEVEQLISLVRNMLLLARADAGIAGLQFSQVFFEDVVLESIARAEKIAKSRGVKIIFNMRSERNDDHDRPQIKADEDLLQNAIFNLIENAVKYSPPSETVSVELVWEEARQLLHIRDHGPGLPKEQIETIFQRFSRGTQNAPGYGLGLAIAQKIAELHNAKIIASNQYQGASNDTGKGPGEIVGAHFVFEIKNF